MRLAADDAAAGRPVTAEADWLRQPHTHPEPEPEPEPARPVSSRHVEYSAVRSLRQPRPRAFEKEARDADSILQVAGGGEDLGARAGAQFVDPFVRQLPPPRGDGVGLPVGERGTRRGLQSCSGPTSVMTSAFFYSGDRVLTAHTDAGSAGLRCDKQSQPARQFLLASSLAEGRELLRIEDQPAAVVSCCANASGTRIGCVCSDGTISIINSEIQGEQTLRAALSFAATERGDGGSYMEQVRIEEATCWFDSSTTTFFASVQRDDAVAAAFVWVFDTEPTPRQLSPGATVRWCLICPASEKPLLLATSANVESISVWSVDRDHPTSRLANSRADAQAAILGAEFEDLLQGDSKSISASAGSGLSLCATLSDDGNQMLRSCTCAEIQSVDLSGTEVPV